LAAVQGEAARGDIVLKLDPALKGEAYSLEVKDSAMVVGGNYNAVAMGAVPLLQALNVKDGKLSLPKLTIADQPDYKMRAIQMCIKHQPHQMSKIKQGVDLCRQFKLNTLALHASNYQILWLLCPAFRENPLDKGSVPGFADGGQTYSPEEWNDLIEYARQRGVAILPEWGPADFVSFMKAWFCKARQFVPEKDFDPTKQTLLDSKNVWAAIDEMAMPRKMNALEVVTWWGDGRAYRHTIEAGKDGKTWKQIVDMSKNTKGSSPEGYKHTFARMSIRYLRFHMMGNTTNNHSHLVEVRAFNTTEAAK